MMLHPSPVSYDFEPSDHLPNREEPKHFRSNYACSRHFLRTHISYARENVSRDSRA